jgi:hypothetical protein
MTNLRGVLSQSAIGCTLLLFAGCSSDSSEGGSSGGARGGTGGTGAGGTSVLSSSNGGQGGGVSASGGQGGKATGGQNTDTGSGGQGGKTSAGAGGQTAGTTGSSQTGGGTTGGAGDTGTATGGKTGGATGLAGNTGAGGQAGAPGIDGGVLVSGCVGGKVWPTANPAAAGPFKVKAEKGVGPLAGYTPDPIYGDKQQRFNIYRPDNLADSGYCHPILVWSNGHTDNPEQNPPDCVVNSAANKWCGQYLPVIEHLASHGFVVIASLSTTTSKGDPLPSIVGLDWLLSQAEDSTSLYYHRLDTAHIGALGHSEGGMATCMMAKDPRFVAISTVSGTSTITAIHGPALFFCGGTEGDNGSVCNNIQKVASSITTQPSMLINNLKADHGSWAYEGAGGVDISGLAAWFRLHLMGDTAQRKRFFGDACTFCTDSRVKVYRNDLMTQ